MHFGLKIEVKNPFKNFLRTFCKWKWKLPYVKASLKELEGIFYSF